MGEEKEAYVTCQRDCPDACGMLEGSFSNEIYYELVS